MVKTFLALQIEVKVAIVIAIICVVLILRILLSRGLNSLFKIQIDHLKQLKHRNKLINSLTLSLLLLVAYRFIISTSWYTTYESIRVASKFVLVFLVITSAQMVIQILKLSHEFFGTLSISRKQSIRPLIQIGQLAVIIVSLLIIVAIITGNNPITLIAGASALTAILGLIFKDILLGFYAGMYLNATKIIQMGDYISINALKAGGIVEEFGLSHIMLRNPDNSTTILPSSTILQNDIINNSTIKEKQGRRIHKTLLIDPKKIKTIDAQKIDFYINKYQLPKGTLLNTNADLLTETIRHYMLRHASINPNSNVLASLSNQTVAGLELTITASTYLSDYTEFANFQSRLLSMIVFYINHFELQKD